MPMCNILERASSAPFEVSSQRMATRGSRRTELQHMKVYAGRAARVDVS